MRIEQRTAMTVLGRDRRLDWQVRQFLDQVLADHSRVPRGAAGEKRYPRQLTKLIVGQSDIRQLSVRGQAVEALVERAPDHLGLLEDFLQHEVRIAVALCRAGIAANGRR